MSEWLRNSHVQEAIRTIVIAVLVAVLGLLGYDARIAQPRISALTSGQRALADASSSATAHTDNLTITVHCRGGECYGTAALD